MRGGVGGSLAAAGRRRVRQRLGARARPRVFRWRRLGSSHRWAPRLARCSIKRPVWLRGRLRCMALAARGGCARGRPRLSSKEGAWGAGRPPHPRPAPCLRPRPRPRLRLCPRPCPRTVRSSSSRRGRLLRGSMRGRAGGSLVTALRRRVRQGRAHPRVIRRRRFGGLHSSSRCHRRIDRPFRGSRRGRAGGSLETAGERPMWPRVTIPSTTSGRDFRRAPWRSSIRCWA